eukprot:gene2705-5587_t
MGNILCDGSPVQDDPRNKFQNRQWETSMMTAPCNNCSGFFLAMFCPCCFAYHLRVRALEGRMENYSCCQGYICPACTSKCIPGQDSCPEFCLCLEVTLCENLAISATRLFIQDQREIQTDPCMSLSYKSNNATCSFLQHEPIAAHTIENIPQIQLGDNRLIRFNNCMQILSCLCYILAIFFKELRHLARLVDLLADIIYCLIQACMQAQTHHELNLHPTAMDYGTVPSITSQPKASDRAPLLSSAPPATSPPATSPPPYSDSHSQK